MAIQRIFGDGSPVFVIIFLCINLGSFCSGNFQCDFEEPALCGFTQDTRDDIEFLHHSGLTPTEGTGPNGDHSSGSGHYMYMESTGGTFGSTARLISPRFNGTNAGSGTNGVTLSFWVHKDGEEMGNLRCLIMNATTGTTTSTTTTSSTMQQILDVPGVLGSDWVKKNVTFPRPSRDFHIIFEATCGASAASDIAIDDVTVNDDVIEITEPPPVEEFNCTFEASGLCVFSQDTRDQFNLIKKQAANNVNSLAMRKDHTFGNGTGKYLSVDAYNRYSWGWRETSSRQSEGDVARLVSPMLAKVNEGEDPACLLFWYHMHGGESVGQIRVYVKNETSEDLGDPVWFLSGERGQVWRAAEIRIEQLLNFQVVFEFVAGNFENIAIDDVSLSRYECPGEHPVAIHSSLDCDFGEAEICYYTHDPTADFNWVWANRATDSSFTGPAQDHTRGDELGFYVHIDSVNQRPGSKARLISPLVSAPRSSSCLEFWYHMYGSHIGELNVYLKFSDSALPDQPSWSRSGNQGNVWHRAYFLVTDMTQNFYVVFEGVLGVYYRTDIAIDDVQYFPNSPCLTYPTEEPVPTTLPAGLQSDLTCSFEEDSCNFTQATDDIMDWRRVRANHVQEDINGYRYRYMANRRYPSWNSLRGPSGDHTNQSPDGWFMAFWYRGSWNKPRLVWNDRARVVSPLLSGSDQPRCLTFFMYKEGYANDFLNVYIKEYGETRNIDPNWAYYWKTNKRWWQILVNIPASQMPVNIIFEAVVPGQNRRFGHYMVFLIDDVTVESGKCARSNGIPGSCDFEEEDSCGYVGGWTRISGETPSRHTGPANDHTLGDANGHYMYYETSQPVRPHQYGDMYSPRMHLLGNQCVRFYYHASGNDTRRLDVYLREPAQYVNGPKFSLLKTVEGKQKNVWMPVSVDIDVSGDFNLVFRAYAGRGYQGDIAIDDIIILPHPCINLKTETSCDFEMGPDACRFVNSAKNGVNWKWYDAIYGKGFPLIGQSVATNSFMYLAPSQPSSKWQLSELYSGHLTVSPMSGDLCVSMEYLIEGSSEQTIIIYVEEKDGARREVGSLTDKNMNEWKMYTSSLLQSHSLRPFIVYQIVFSIRSPNDKAVVAIDNFIVSSTTCDSLVGSWSGRAQAQSSKRSNRSGMAAGIIILILIMVAVISVIVFIYRSRIQSIVLRCSQSVTEMNYKRHDAAFVNEDKKESVEIPSIVTPGVDEQETIEDNSQSNTNK